MIMIVSTATRRYAVRRDDLTVMQVVASPADLYPLQSTDRPAIPVDLGELLDPADQSVSGRKHGLVVPMRRRPIVFLVERVEQSIEQPTIQPLPVLITRCFKQAWAVGVLHVDNELTILLDLRAIARSILAQRSAAN